VLAWLANTCLGAAIGTAWLSGLPAWDSPRTAVFAVGALVADVGILALVPGIVVLLLALGVPSRRILAAAQALVWTLFQLLLYADTRIWRLFRYHFNPMVWNVITTPGSEDAVELGTGTWLFTAGVGVVLFLASSFAWTRWFLPASAGVPPRGKLASRLALALGAIVVLEKGLYAWADLNRDRSITGLGRAFPLYQRLTVQKFARRVFGVKLEERPRVELGGPTAILRYPIEEPRIDPAGPRPNILVFVIDSLRADMLAEETMPRTSAFSANARRFEDHLSGGNATRHGIFSLLYGIHGTYWMPVRVEHAPPVLLTVLAKLGYDLHAFSTSSLSFPEFRSTAFVAMEDAVEDRFPFKRKAERDAYIPVRFDEWLGEREAAGRKGPFFCFAFADAPHGTYDWPRENTVFTPCVDRVDYIDMSGSPSKELIGEVFNSYRNAVHFADSVVGRMLEALERRGILDETIVVVTGDHGEEFFEHGYFGHTSNFTAVQTHVPLVIGGPGIPPGVERRPTSHVDLAPTLLELLGADPSVRAKWSQGEDLLAPPETRERVIASWDEVAVRLPGGILRVPLEGSRGFVEAYDEQWKRLDDEEAWIRSSGAAMARLALECRRFLR